LFPKEEAQRRAGKREGKFMMLCAASDPAGWVEVTCYYLLTIILRRGREGGRE
jgi:hypothetical protein